MFFCLFTLCSAHVSALVTAVSDKRRQIVGVHLAGASVTKSATLGYVGIHKSWQDNTSEAELWRKVNTDRKK
jgi:hypothetical protein